MELIRGTEIYITVDNVRVCYNDSGDSPIPIMFIHGFPFNKDSWQPQVDFLRERHRVITYDVRGFGKSELGDDEASIIQYADDLIGLMDALEIPKAIVCGLSMGGYILMNAVHRYPDRFEGIILADTQCNADSPEAKEKRYQSIDKINTDGTNEYADASVKNLFCKNTIESNTELVNNIREVIVSTPPVSITSTLEALAKRPEACAFLNEISCFTLIICGKEDSITPVAKAEFLNTSIKNSTLVIIDNAGHLSNLENPEEFNHAMGKFITKTLARF
jgi:3-oxoadipate enol-lactonase